MNLERLFDLKTDEPSAEPKVPSQTELWVSTVLSGLRTWGMCLAAVWAVVKILDALPL